MTNTHHNKNKVKFTIIKITNNPVGLTAGRAYFFCLNGSGSKLLIYIKISKKILKFSLYNKKIRRGQTHEKHS